MVIPGPMVMALVVLVIPWPLVMALIVVVIRGLVGMAVVMAVMAEVALVLVMGDPEVLALVKMEQLVMPLVVVVVVVPD